MAPPCNMGMTCMGGAFCCGAACCNTGYLCCNGASGQTPPTCVLPVGGTCPH
jgi:hypothetical protein